MAQARANGLPRCPDGHRGHVILWGRYGGTHKRGSHQRLSRRRQRYRCLPRHGAPHTFTELLPRLQPEPPAPADCLECEREFTSLDAPPGVPKHSYSLSEIADGLIAVGAGKTYRGASARVRTQAERGPSPVTSPHANREFGLVADWVELFAPAITKALLPKRWPVGPGSTVVLDATPFSLSGAINVQTGFPRRGGGAWAWTILCAGAYYGSEFTIVRLRAVAGVPQLIDWQELLVSVPGAPERVVSDQDITIKAAVRYCWPNAVWYAAWDKLRRRLRDADDSILRKAHRQSEYDVLWQCAAEAFESKRQWLNFVAWARTKPRAPGVTKWLRTNARLVHTQLRQLPYWPGDSGPLEQRNAEIRQAFEFRKGMVKNRDRTNLLLGLMTLRFNQVDDKRRYRELIRRALIDAAAVTPPGSADHATTQPHQQLAAPPLMSQDATH